MVRRPPPPPPIKPNQTQAVDIQEASRITGLTVGTIYLYVRRKIIPFNKEVYRLRFNPEELRQWCARRPKGVRITVDEALTNLSKNQKRKKK